MQVSPATQRSLLKNKAVQRIKTLDNLVGIFAEAIPAYHRGDLHTVERLFQQAASNPEMVKRLGGVADKQEAA